MMEELMYFLFLSLLAVILGLFNPFYTHSDIERFTFFSFATMAYIEIDTDYSFANSEEAKLFKQTYLSHPNEAENLEANALGFFKPNEMGEIMIIMYHDLIENDEEEGPYSRTYANFEKDMLRLLKSGYQPITMRDLVSGNIDLPMGVSPVVITFDDGHASDIAFEEDGSLSRKSAVGILEALGKDYPKFKPTATFYLNGPQAFGDWEYDPKKIKFLLDRGYEIANHTSNHENLSEISLDEAKEEIISQAKRLENYTHSKSFSFALPFGEKFENYDSTIKSGWLGDYEMLSSVNVGWSPVVSVYSKDFNPLNLNRITCGSDEFELDYWLDYMEDNPDRYVSDGLRGTLTIPEARYEEVDQDKVKNLHMRVVLYNEEYEIIEN